VKKNNTPVMTKYWLTLDSVSIQALVSNNETFPFGPTDAGAATGRAFKLGRDDMGDGGPHTMSSSNSAGDEEFETQSALLDRRARLIQTSSKQPSCDNRNSRCAYAGARRLS
jgi:hypothetical protein